MRERSSALVSDKRNLPVVGWVVNLVFRVLSYLGGSKISDIQLIIIVNRGKCSTIWRAQLFEGQLALNPGLNLTQVSFSSVQKHFLR